MEDRLTAEEGGALLAVARAAIDRALAAGETDVVEPDPASYPAALRREGASFVTLRIGPALRGCVGTVVPRQPLVVDVVGNACSAAFRDQRFSPLTPEEWPEVAVSLSVLTPMREIEVTSEAGLTAELRPGVDGVLIRAEGCRATFLPQVWDSLPEPGDFLRQLKVKMGRSVDWWSDELRAWRYEARKFE